ncbi:hypothetical protein LB565_26470 [Mesorhizobium sp. CA14]|uniref:hypothetical protein n=1 Tax=Mesorhizobium sp. CA14 TaxID=2876642 RepID=UPI001CC977B5|nr:hypothetical protein [Mesorhizobium sp. CA14]MBZ9851539.1 hypothetical protein [Mesorhizobium sp. CA14]
MDLNNLLATSMVLGLAATSCVFLLPKSSQDHLDEKVNALSDRVRKITFWNFARIERDVAFSWLEFVFGAKVSRPRFYVNVAFYSGYATAISLVPYFFIPFSDPLTVSLVGYPIFVVMGFFIPSMIIATISMAVAVALLSLGARLKNGLYYFFLTAVDIVVVAALVAALSVNLEFTREYLEAVYLGQTEPNRWLGLYQPFLAIAHIVSDPTIIIKSIRVELYTANKYTTYSVSIVSMLCAVLPVVVHLACAIFILSMAIFHNAMKHVASFLLARMYEQKTFKFLGWLFGVPPIFIKLCEMFFSKSA